MLFTCLSILPVTQAGTPFSLVTKKSFPEPNVVGFGDAATGMEQCFVISEKSILLEVKPPTVFAAMQTVLAVYYALHVDYPQSSIPATCVLLFLQEQILQHKDKTSKPVRYTSFVNSI